jgi:hypothetical protein
MEPSLTPETWRLAAAALGTVFLFVWLFLLARTLHALPGEQP